jgi:hypothetical protein
MEPGSSISSEPPALHLLADADVYRFRRINPMFNFARRFAWGGADADTRRQTRPIA